MNQIKSRTKKLWRWKSKMERKIKKFEKAEKQKSNNDMIQKIRSKWKLRRISCSRLEKVMNWKWKNETCFGWIKMDQNRIWSMSKLQKERLPNDWTQKFSEITPDIPPWLDGSVRGYFFAFLGHKNNVGRGLAPAGGIYDWYMGGGSKPPPYTAFPGA